MKFETLRYGTIHVNREDIITFKEGLLGFPKCTRFALLDEEEAVPFRILQSLDTAHLAFVVIDPLIIRPDYHFKLTMDDIKIINAPDVKNVSVYCIVSLASNLKDATINLQGPLVINNHNQLAHQYILFDDLYAVNERLIKTDQKAVKKELNQAPLEAKKTSAG